MNKEQIAFEKWARCRYHNFEFAVDDDGHYKKYELRSDWLVWKARAQLDKQDTSEIVAEIDELMPRLDKARREYANRVHIPICDAYETLTKIRKHLTKE